ncbi:MAG: hypothetical protein QW063_02585, partial [Candidatus Nanoarchaeia archaeon]
MSKISKSSKEKSDVTGITPPKDGLTINQIYDELKVLEEHVKDLESIVLQQKRQGETTIDKKIKELEILKKALTDYVVKLEEIRPTIELLCSSPFSELKTKLQLLRAYRANLEKPEVQEFLKLIGQYATSPEKLEQLGAAIHLVGEAVDYAGITDQEPMKRMLQLLCAIAKYPPKEMEEQIKKVNELYQTMSEYDAKVTEMTKVLNAQTIMINDLTKVLNKSLTVSSNMEQDLEKIVQTYVKYDGLPQGVPKEVEYRFPDCVVRVAESGEMQFDNDMYGAGNQIYRDPRGVWRLSNSNLDLGQELQPLF